MLVCLDSFSSLCNFLFEEHFLFGYIVVLAGKKLLLNIFEDSLSFDVEYSSKYFKTARDVGKKPKTIFVWRNLSFCRPPLSKTPIINGHGKLFLFTLKIEISIVLQKI